jgi:DNA/RNA endonuclease YhcR with UshA esterase domain
MKLTFLLTALALAPVLRADDKKDAAPAKEERSPEAKETPATNELPRVSAGDIEGVKKLIGKKAVVFGKVISSKEVEKSGISFLDLDGGKFTVVCFKDNYSKFPDAQSPAKIYKGKTVEITGDIIEYRKTPNSSPQPEIKLTDPSQIKVVEAAKDEAKDAKGKTEKKG